MYVVWWFGGLLCVITIQSRSQGERNVSRILLIALPTYHREVISKEVAIIATNELRMNIYTALCK